MRRLTVGLGPLEKLKPRNQLTARTATIEKAAPARLSNSLTRAAARMWRRIGSPSQ